MSNAVASEKGSQPGYSSKGMTEGSMFITEKGLVLTGPSCCDFDILSLPFQCACIHSREQRKWITNGLKTMSH